MHLSRRNIAIVVALCAIGAALVFAPRLTLSQSAGPILGYAWSDTIGWIDLNCANSNVCASKPFGFVLASDGSVSGHAWSDNIGWVSANPADLAGCPASPCSARLSSSAFSGWLKALTGGSPQSGGWDGFVSLSGPTYGVTRESGSLSGFAWGSTVVGWVDFALTIGQCTPVYSCVGNSVRNSCSDEITACLPGFVCSAGACIPANQPPAASLRVAPALVRTNEPTTVIWSATEVTSCSVSEDNPEFTDAWTGPAGSERSSPITARTTYTLSCLGDGGAVTRSASVNILPTFQER